MTDELFKEDRCLFQSKVEDEVFYLINPKADFELIEISGKIFGKALFEGIPIQARLSNLLLKELLDLDLELDDL